MSTIKSSSEHLTLNADGAGKDVIIQSNATEKLRLTAEGNLHLQGSDSRIQLNAQGGANVVGNNTVHIRADGANLKLMAASGGTCIYEVNGSEKLRIQSGGGISFNGDTAAANSLDDYEEGTWTPQIVGYSGGTTQTYAAQTGKYTKIGNMVYASFHVKLSAKGDIAGNYTLLKGMPYNHSTLNGGSLIISNFQGLNTATNWVGGDLSSIASWVWLTRGVNGTSHQNINTSEIGNATAFTGTMVYRV